MNIINYSFACMVAIGCLFILHNKKQKPNLIKGKLVHQSCASVVVQIQDENYFYLANNVWRNGADKNSYEHVFLVKNSCAFREKNISKDEIFYFNIVDDVTTNEGCTQCLKYESTPRIILAIEAVKGNN